MGNRIPTHYSNRPPEARFDFPSSTPGRQVYRTVAVLLMCAIWLSRPAWGATPTPSKTNAPPEATDTKVTAIPAAEIAEQAEQDSASQRSIETELTDSAIKDLQQQLPVVEEEISARSEENSRILAHSSSLELFGRLESGWRGLNQELSEWSRLLSRRANLLQKRIEDLQTQQRRWELTRKAEQDKLPGELTNRVEKLIQGEKETGKRVEEELGEILRLQSRVSEQGSRVNESLLAIEQARQQIMRHLLVRDSPALWSGEVRSSEPQKLAAQGQSSLTRQWTELKAYWSRQRERLGVQALIFAVLAVLLARAHHRLMVRSLTQEDLEPTARSLGAPVASALLVALCVSPWLYSQAPRLWWSLLGGAALIPAMRVLRLLVAKPLFGLLNVLAGLYLLDQVRSIAASQPLLWRLLFLAEMLAGAFYCRVLLRAKIVAGQAARKSPARLLTIVLRVGLVLFSAAMLSNVVGYGRFSSLVGNVTLSAAYLAVVLYAMIRVGEATIRVILRATPAAEIGVVRRREPLLESRSRQGLQWIAVTAWIFFVLQGLALQHSTIGALKRAAETPITIGSWSFTVWHVVLFVLAIWASVLVSRFVRFILEEEVYPHFRLAAGLNYSISKAVHYLMVLVGFLIGLGLIGVSLTNLTIVAGAFGVGLGFGMQNIVNNFVSGIILLFERPIKVGDVVQLDSTEGVVKRIGIRASIVRSSSGSEIIVPNAKLISDPVTNWTFSQRRRLITMPIAVTSESEPKKVMEVLRSVAGQHPHVAKEADKVQALLTNLNNGTANYELRAWTDQSENWEQVRSDLFMSIKSTLAAEGIAMR
jgi:potassium efflux system protein